MDSHRLFFVCVDAHCSLLFLYLTPGVFFRRLAEYYQKRFTTENQSLIPTCSSLYFVMF